VILTPQFYVVLGGKTMLTFIVGVVCLVVGFIFGFLVYRNNVKNLKETEETLKNKVVVLEEELKKLKP
jgi:uncharacterized protein YneF (UPF0154 family)